MPTVIERERERERLGQPWLKKKKKIDLKFIIFAWDNFFLGLNKTLNVC